MSTTRTRTAITTALLAAVLAGTTACGGDTDTGATPTSSEPPKITDIEHAGRSPEQQATEGAIAAVKGMYSAQLEVEGDHTKDLNILSQYMVDPYLKAMRENVTLRRSKGIVSEGEIRVVRTKPEEVTAPKDEDGNPIPGEAEVLLKACVDVSDFHAFDPEGNDTVDPNRLEQSQGVFRVVNEDWPSGAGWRVVENTLPTVEECDAY
jgi:hypothetical protein